MANYVTNIVRFKGDENRIDELRASVQDERYGITGIDFDKIIPMPKNLFMGAIGPMERELYGKNNWLDWSLANWGSKWNSMPTEDPDEEYEPGTLRFLTANNPPHPVLQKLSEMYPDITMEHQWADDMQFSRCNTVPGHSRVRGTYHSHRIPAQHGYRAG